MTWQQTHDQYKSNIHLHRMKDTKTTIVLRDLLMQRPPKQQWEGDRIIDIVMAYWIFLSPNPVIMKYAAETKTKEHEKEIKRLI